MDKHELKAIYVALQRIRAEHELTADDQVDLLAIEQLLMKLAMQQIEPTKVG